MLNSNWLKSSLHSLNCMLDIKYLMWLDVISSPYVSILLPVWKIFLLFSEWEQNNVLVNPSWVSWEFSGRHFQSHQRVEPWSWCICPDNNLYFRRIVLWRYAICPLHSPMGNRVNSVSCVQHNKTQTPRSLNSCSVESRVWAETLSISSAHSFFIHYKFSKLLQSTVYWKLWFTKLKKAS